MKIDFTLDNINRSGRFGDTVYSVPELVYRDAPANLVNSLIAKVKKGEKWRDLVSKEFKEKKSWLAKIILHEKRNDFLALIPEFNNDFIALDVGAGWGQHTIDISKKGKICSIEPSPERFEFMRAICDQENTKENCFFISASLGQLKFDPVFDFAICIGVLEWIGKFENCVVPRKSQIEFLKNIKRSLKKNKPLVVGIENRLGLKYLIGSNDDHIGLPHIACLEFEDANRKWEELGRGSLKVATYSMAEYQLIFKEAGFTKLIFYSAMPDYKIPERIIECYPNDLLSQALISSEFFDEHDGSNGKFLDNNEVLKSVYKSLAREKVSPLFSPSYFIVAR